MYYSVDDTRISNVTVYIACECYITRDGRAEEEIKWCGITPAVVRRMVNAPAQCFPINASAGFYYENMLVQQMGVEEIATEFRAIDNVLQSVDNDNQYERDLADVLKDIAETYAKELKKRLADL